MRFATEGHKCLPFETGFKTLGLEIDTKDFQDGCVLVGHTPSRKQELHDQLQEVLGWRYAQK